tara:strand:+ start:1852 stop:2253 length:402 start_codon:yes stop_codon:yes gene_type:complete
MANTLTQKKISTGLRTLLVENGSDDNITTAQSTIIDAVDAEGYDRATIQIRNTEGATITAQVWGTLFDGAEALPAANSKWVQIGDDIEVANNTGAIKAISTTGLRMIAVTIARASSNSDFDAGNCKVFLQGTI